jgi:hypothetical protein
LVDRAPLPASMCASALTVVGELHHVGHHGLPDA